MGAVTERLEISLEEAKAYFRVDTDLEDEVIVDCVDTDPEDAVITDCVDADPEDAVITDCVDAAKSEADAYLQNSFVDADGTDLPIPPALKMWVLKRAHYHYTQRVGGVSSESVSGIGSVAYGDAFAELKPYRKKVVRFV